MHSSQWEHAGSSTTITRSMRVKTSNGHKAMQAPQPKHSSWSTTNVSSGRRPMRGAIKTMVLVSLLSMRSELCFFSNKNRSLLWTPSFPVDSIGLRTN